MSSQSLENISKGIALLAPVPIAHLESGLEICDREGKVAFGSRAWEVFRELESCTGGKPVSVYIYASYEHADGPPAATWMARYAGHVESNHGAHPDGMRYRPPTTADYPADNLGHWAVFWEVESLRRLGEDDWIPTHAFGGYGKKGKYKKGFVPEGPLVVSPPG